jgi:hypothetical protein
VARAVLVATLLLVALVTLTPGSGDGGADGAGRLCLVCGEKGGVDFLLNLLLFLPLGAAAAALGWPAGATVTAGLGVTILIEALQLTVVRGRDASLGDLLSNGAGVALGWVIGQRWRWWWNPAPPRAWVHGVAAGTGGALVLVLSGLLLEPSPTDRPWYGQRAPALGHLSPFRGRLLEAELNGERLPSARLPEPLLSDSLEVEALATPPDSGSPLVAPIASVFDADHAEQVLLGQAGRDLVFRARLRAQDWRLQQLGVALPAAWLPDSEPVRARGVRTRSALRLELERGGVVRRTALALEPGLGWALILPVVYHQLDPRRTAAVSLLWLAVLGWPAGWFAGRAARFGWAGPAILVAGYCGAGGFVGWGAPPGFTALGLVAAAVTGWAMGRRMLR